MTEIIIKNWGDADILSVYQQRVKHEPLVYSVKDNLWIAHSYEFCEALFLNSDAIIPELVRHEEFQSVKQVNLLISSLARLSNDENHLKSRVAAELIYKQIKNVDVSALLDSLLSRQENLADFDFVSAVAMQLPVLQILKGLDFVEEAVNWITGNLQYLIKIMSPVKTISDLKMLDIVVPEFFDVVSAHKELVTLAEYLHEANPEIAAEEATSLIISNLIGLLIQCYDAGRGLLTNVVLQLEQLNMTSIRLKQDPLLSRKVVVEILRLNPPVHNTRRIARKDLIIGGISILKGQFVMIVMAAANLDHQKFENPARFDPERINNKEHLTFGLGGHACLAKHLMIGQAADVFDYLIFNYNPIIHHQDITYESQLNVRLVKRLTINLNKI